MTRAERDRDCAKQLHVAKISCMKFPEHSVVVHSFRCFDVNAGSLIVPPFKATEQAILHQFQGEVLPLTAEIVDRSELDSEGRWFRLASGWAGPE